MVVIISIMELQACHVREPRLTVLDKLIQSFVKSLP